MKFDHFTEILKTIILESVLVFIIFHLLNGDIHKTNDVISALGFASFLYIPVEFVIKYHMGIVCGIIELLVLIPIMGYVCTLNKYFSLPILFYPAAKIIFHLACLFGGEKGIY